MCGIVGIVGYEPVNQDIYNSLLVLQHRGQDAAGIVTTGDDHIFHLRKANGLVSEVFQQNHMARLIGNIGIGHVRYPTAGTSSVLEAQPFIVNSPYGLALVHNGNLTNVKKIKETLLKKARRHINTTSDSECLLNIIAYYLEHIKHFDLTAEDIFKVIRNTNAEIEGAYACLLLIDGYGMVAFRDPHGIRPLVLGQKEIIDQVTGKSKTEYMFASETVALDIAGYAFVRDVAPGEAVYVTLDGKLYAQQCYDDVQLQPCIFEYVYFARPDSFMNGASVYATRINMGIKLGNKIIREWQDVLDDIDVVIPVPETSCDIALQIANILNKPYRQGFVKNRYIGRTFIMPGQAQRQKSVRRKLNTISLEFKNKNVLLVDDSIVRGTTSEQIIQLAREAGAKKVYFASAAPEIRYPNVYGIDMPTSHELIAYNKDLEQITAELGADKLIFQDLADLKEAVQLENPAIKSFDDSVFSGNYVVGNIKGRYLVELEQARSDSKKEQANKQI